MNTHTIYIVEYGRNEEEEDFELIKIEGHTAYEYNGKEWHENKNLYSMLYDPGPWAEHVDEIRANEIMKIIDRFD